MQSATDLHVMALTHGLIGVQEQNISNTSDTASAGSLMPDATPSEPRAANQPIMLLRALSGPPSDCDSEVSTSLADIAGLLHRVTTVLHQCLAIACACKPAAAAAAVTCTPADCVTYNQRCLSTTACLNRKQLVADMSNALFRSTQTVKTKRPRPNCLSLSKCGNATMDLIPVWVR